MTVPRRLLVGAVCVTLGVLGVTSGAGTASAMVPREDPAPVSSGDLSWRLTPTGSATRLRGLSAVSDQVAWASGDGTVLKTTDGGGHWSSVAAAGTGALQLRDVEATSEHHAVVMSAGPGSASRLYVTDDGGATWTLTYQNDAPDWFFDCLSFSTPQQGLVVSDPVDGAFRFLETTDGGHSWSVVNPDGVPPSRPNEFAVGASGSCLTTGDDQAAYLGSGGDNPQRIYLSDNHGHTWSTSDVPLAVGPSAGVFSVRFQDRFSGIALGGDLANPAAALGNAAWTVDGGLSWQPAATPPLGYRSGSAWLAGEFNVALAVGPSGSDMSSDAGRTWSPFDGGSFDSVACARDGGCWASGEQGRVARLVVRAR